MHEYLVVIEKTETVYSVNSPDVDGCVAAAESRQEVEHVMNEALLFHIEAMIEEGYSVPEPSAYPKIMKIAA